MEKHYRNKILIFIIIITTVVDTGTDFRTYYHLTPVVYCGYKDVLQFNEQTRNLNSTGNILQQLSIPVQI